jgi:hypothetical protein
MGQYEGMINRPIWDPETNQIRSAKWNDRILIPSFRLPSKNEIHNIKQSINSSLKEYEPNAFLRYWTKYYLEINKHQTILRIEENNFLSFSYNENVIMRPEYQETFGTISEIALDQLLYKKENSILKIFSDLGQNVVEIDSFDTTILKDSLGHMPFIIIAEDENLNPIYIERADYSKENSNCMKQEKKYSMFRYALSGIKK